MHRNNYAKFAMWFILPLLLVLTAVIISIAKAGTECVVSLLYLRHCSYDEVIRTTWSEFQAQVVILGHRMWYRY
jgi:hypothetical protein